MQENKKTNKKTIIFQSVEVKSFCDALIQAESRKTGISIMRLIENALIKEFGFENDKLNEWCCCYCCDSATTSYMSLLQLLPDNDDVFVLYKMICNYVSLPIMNDVLKNNDGVKKVMANNNMQANSNVSDDKTAKRIFALCSRKELDKAFGDFVYSHSSILDKDAVPLEDIVTLLLNIEGRSKTE